MRRVSPDVLFSDEELRILQAIDDVLNRPTRQTIREQEMACQRSMMIRGKRLYAYHMKLGDLADYLPEIAA